MAKNSTILRELLEADEILLMPFVGSPLQAELAAKVGFPAIGISGAMTSANILGLPDAGFITMTELVQQVDRVCTAVNLPVLVDCDTGFGNAINVRRTVASVIRAGAAGMFIEDQVAPKRCGFSKGKEVISLEEAVGKYQAALDARNELDPDVVIMSRTDARGAVGGSLEEAIRRAKAYREVGVDVVYVEALQSVEEIKQARAAVDGLMFATTQAIQPHPTLQQLQDLGLCMAATSAHGATLVAQWDLLVAIKQRGFEPLREFGERIGDHPMGRWGMFDITGFPKVVEWEKKYLSPEKMAKYDNSLGNYDARSRPDVSVKTAE